MTSLADRIRLALAKPPPRTLPVGSDRASAVLLPILLRETGATLLFVRKSAHLRKHSGQVGFPGGKVDPADGSVEAAALREAYEEVGLGPGQVELLGALDDERTFVTSFHIRPLVGLVPNPPLQFQPDASEIDLVFEVSLAEAVHAVPLSWTRLDVGGIPLVAPRFQLGGHVVWGASARILAGLQQRLASVVGRAQSD